MLRGGDASDEHPELVRLETEEDVEKLIARQQAQGGHPLGSAPARLLRLLGARLAALGGAALPGRGRPTGRPATDSAARETDPIAL
jgi:hypothetical protein